MKEISLKQGKSAEALFYSEPRLDKLCYRMKIAGS
jgi:hypothetical protein